jgi:3-oxoadipate enol-lactonase
VSPSLTLVRHWITADDGADVAWEEAGAAAKPAVVLLHAFPFDSRMWRSTAEALAGDYHVIMPTWRGFAPSPRGEGAARAGGPRSHAPAAGIGPYTLRTLAGDVKAVCAAAGVRRAIFVGSSIGGYVLFEMLRTHAELIGAIVFCNTRPQADTPEARNARLDLIEQLRGPDADARGQFNRRTATRLLSSYTREAQPQVAAQAAHWIAEAPTAAVIAASQAMAERGDSTDLLGLVQAPVLVVAGEHDEVIPPRDAQAWAAMLPNAQFIVIERAGHLPSIETPGELNRHILEFARRHAAAL